MDELDAKLNRIADLADELKEMKTKHEMTAAQNANMFVKLQVSLSVCLNPSSVCVGALPALSCSSSGLSGYSRSSMQRSYLGNLSAVSTADHCMGYTP